MIFHSKNNLAAVNQVYKQKAQRNTCYTFTVLYRNDRDWKDAVLTCSCEGFLPLCVICAFSEKEAETKGRVWLLFKVSKVQK